MVTFQRVTKVTKVSLCIKNLMQKRETSSLSVIRCCGYKLETVGGLYVFAANEDTSSSEGGDLNPQVDGRWTIAVKRAGPGTMVLGSNPTYQLCGVG